MNTLLQLALHAPPVPAWFQPEIPPPPPEPVDPTVGLTEAQRNAYYEVEDILDKEPGALVQPELATLYAKVTEYYKHQEAWSSLTASWEDHHRFFAWRKYFAEHLSEVMR